MPRTDESDESKDGRRRRGNLSRVVILGLAGNERVRHAVSRHGLGAGADRFVAGETLDDCLGVLARLRAEGLRTYTIALGEGVRDAHGAAAAAAAYGELIPRVMRSAPGNTFSIKLTHLGLELAPEVALRHARQVLTVAAEHGAFARIDMEDSRFVDDTIAIYRQLRADGHDNTGLVLQAYLYRTLGDLVDLLALEPNVRVVKGAYLEPATVARQRKAEVDLAYHDLIRLALRHAKFTAVATHDQAAIATALRVVQASGTRPDFEFQMLYGVRHQLATELVGRGHDVRVCVPFGPDWFAYFSRRLAERPANLLFLLRNLVRR